MVAFYSFARQSYKKIAAGYFFGCAARPRAAAIKIVFYWEQ